MSEKKILLVQTGLNAPVPVKLDGRKVLIRVTNVAGSGILGVDDQGETSKHKLYPGESVTLFTDTLAVRPGERILDGAKDMAAAVTYEILDPQ